LDLLLDLEPGVVVVLVLDGSALLQRPACPKTQGIEVLAAPCRRPPPARDRPRHAVDGRAGAAPCLVAVLPRAARLVDGGTVTLLQRHDFQ
jgi:hypothetical protein